MVVVLNYTLLIAFILHIVNVALLVVITNYTMESNFFSLIVTVLVIPRLVIFHPIVPRFHLPSQLLPPASSAVSSHDARAPDGSPAVGVFEVGGYLFLVVLAIFACLSLSLAISFSKDRIQ